MSVRPILIVDDDQDYLDSIKTQFNSLGVPTITSTTQENASEILVKHWDNLDAVVVDLDLSPGDRESGITFLETIASKLKSDASAYLITDKALTPKLNDRLKNLNAKVIDKADAKRWRNIFTAGDFDASAPADEAIDAALFRSANQRKTKAVAEGREYYSCFISYADEDETIARRLYEGLDAAGVRCWFAPESLDIGAMIRPTIDRAIKEHERVLLILSEHSLKSAWVEHEVETTLAREKILREKEGTFASLILPIRVDDAIERIDAGWASLLKNTRYMGDFTSDSKYRKSFTRILKALRK